MFIAIRDVTLTNVGHAEPYAFMRELGIDTVEVRVMPDGSLDSFDPAGGGLPPIVDRASCESVLASSAASGVKVGAILLNTRYHAVEADGASERRWIEMASDLAREAGIGVLRIDIRPGTGETEDGFLARIRPRLAEHLSLAGERGVGLAVENHGAFTNRRDFLARLLDAFGLQGLSLTLDTGNFYCTGGYPLSEVYDIIRQFASRVTQVHVKNISYPEEARQLRGHLGCEYARHSCPIHEGDVDHKQVLSVLSEAGYAGGLYLEDESLHKYDAPRRAGNITQAVRHLRDIIDGIRGGSG